MAVSARTKTGLALTALLPVLASIYGEHQQQSAQQQVRRETAQRAEQATRDQERLLDRASADALRGAIETAVADPRVRSAVAPGSPTADAAQALCLKLFMGSELLRLGQYAGQTANVLAATLSYRLESGDPARPGGFLACQCKATLRQIVDSWKRPGSAQAPTLFIKALEAADLACTDPVINLISPPPLPVAADPADPSGVAAPPPASTPNATVGSAATLARDRERVLEQLRTQTLTPAQVEHRGQSKHAGAGLAMRIQTPCPEPPAEQPSALRPRVFFHSPDNNLDGRLFECLRGELSRLGYRVQELDGVPSAPRLYEVRYVYSEAEPEAQRLIDNLGALSAEGRVCASAMPERMRGRCPTLKAIPQYANRVLPNSLEVWLPAVPSSPIEVPP